MGSDCVGGSPVDGAGWVDLLAACLPGVARTGDGAVGGGTIGGAIGGGGTIGRGTGAAVGVDAGGAVVCLVGGAAPVDGDAGGGDGAGGGGSGSAAVIPVGGPLGDTALGGAPLAAAPPRGAPPGDAPPGDIALGDAPVGDTPVGDTPVGDTPVGTSLVVAPIGSKMSTTNRLPSHETCVVAPADMVRSTRPAPVEMAPTLCGGWAGGVMTTSLVKRSVRWLASLAC